MSTDNVNMFNSFGEALFFSLEINHLTQVDFSEKWGKDPGQISKYINNITMPRPRMIKEIETLLNVEFKKVSNGWSIINKNPSQAIAHGVELLNKDRLRFSDLPEDFEPSLDDLADLVRFRDMLQDKIDKLVRKK